MNLLEECRAAMPSVEWTPDGDGCVYAITGATKFPVSMKVGSTNGRIVFSSTPHCEGISWQGRGATVREAFADLQENILHDFGPLLPPDPVQAVAESITGSLFGGAGRRVTEWRTSAGLLRVTVEVEP